MTCSGNWAYFGITRARGPFWWEVQEFSSFKNYLLLILFLILCCYLTLQWWAQHTLCMKLGRWADGTQVHIRLLFLPPHLQGFTRSRLSSFSPSVSTGEFFTAKLPPRCSRQFWTCKQVSPGKKKTTPDLDKCFTSKLDQATITSLLVVTSGFLQ